VRAGDAYGPVIRAARLKAAILGAVRVSPRYIYPLGYFTTEKHGPGRRICCRRSGRTKVTSPSAHGASDQSADGHRAGGLQIEVGVALVASSLYESERIPTLLARPQVRNLGSPRLDTDRHFMHVSRRARGTFLVGAGGDTFWHVHFPFGPRGSTVSGAQRKDIDFVIV
jgi:hypothetical protein